MNKNNWTFVIVITLILCSALYSTAWTQPHTFHTGQASQIDSLKATVDSLLKENEIPGASIALVNKDSVIWSGGIGYANYEDQEQATATQLFRVGSVSKSFVAMGILQLVEEGELSLNEKVQKLVPEIKIKNPWRETDPVRIKHLLEHTAGFDDMHFSEFINANDNPRMPLEEALAITPASRVVRWKPGTRFSYSNPGYGVAGYIIEKVTGQRYEQYLKEQVLEPIGMDQSSFTYTDSVQQQLVSGYRDNYEPAEYQHIYLRPSGMLHSSANEMAQFVRLMLNDGDWNGQSIVEDSLLHRMETPMTSLAAKHGYKQGYGLGVKSSTAQGYSYLGHAGGIPGFSAQYMYFPEHNRGFVLLVNSMGGFGEISDAITKYLLRDVPKPEPKPITELPSQKLVEYAGYYEMRSLRNQLFAPIALLLDGFTLNVARDTLKMSDFGGANHPLLPVSEHQFRRKDEVVPSTLFMDTQEYGRAMVYDGKFYIKTGVWKKYLYRGALFGGLGLLATLLLFSMFWIPFEAYRYVRAKRSPMKYQRLFWWPFAALLSLVVLIGAGSQLSLLTIGQKTVSSVLIMISTYLFGIASIGAFWVAFRSWQQDIHWGLKSYFSLAALALVGFSLFLAYWDWMGIRLWAY